MTWINLHQQKPEQKQPVFYYFGAFDCVYAGFYVSQIVHMGNHHEYESNCFYSDKGFLGDDVTWWQPREEGQVKPERPSEELRRQCRYWPESFDERVAKRKQNKDTLLAQFEQHGFKIKRCKL